MSFFGSLIGNAAIAGNGIIGREIEHRQSIEQDKQRSTSALANSKLLADHNSELAHQKSC